jgi:hypothetical protein
VRAQSFSEPDQEPTFDVPRSGILQDGGFKDGTAQLAVLPREVAGLEPYRSGSTATSQITSFSDGMTYLKVVRSKAKADPGDLRVAEEVELANGPGYYFPASEVLGRHLEIFSHGRSVQLFSNLPRDTLLSVAGSLAIGGESAPRTIRKPGGVVIDRLDPRAALSRFSLTLEQLPPGYLPASAARTRVEGPGTETVTLYLRRPEAEFDGLGIRLVMSTPVAFLPPSSEEFVDLTIGGHGARWSAERGELEWLEGTTYRAVLTPSSDLSTALQIVEAIG